MSTEIIVQVFLFAHLCMFFRIISNEDMPQIHQRNFIACYAKDDNPI